MEAKPRFRITVEVSWDDVPELTADHVRERVDQLAVDLITGYADAPDTWDTLKVERICCPGCTHVRKN